MSRGRKTPDPVSARRRSVALQVVVVSLLAIVTLILVVISLRSG